jgi:hypothetical protein
MAKRRRIGRTLRRRKNGALSFNASSPLVKFGSIAAGYFMSDAINEPIEKAVGDKVDGKIVAAAEAVAGFLLSMRGKKTTLKVAAGGILLGAGLKKFLKETGVIKGFDDVPVIGGYDSVPVLSGYTTRPIGINGYTVPQPMASKPSVMGGINVNSGGSGSGLGYMDSDR